MAGFAFRLPLLVAAVALAGLAAAGDAPERRWDLRLEGFFSKGLDPISIYARERGGQWVSAVGSSVIPGSRKYSFNKSYHFIDLSQVPLVNGAMKGAFRIYLVPDLWVPSKHWAIPVDCEIDAAVKPDGTIAGSWKVLKVNSDDPTAQNFGKGGMLLGTAKPYTPAPLPDPITFSLNMHGALVGGKASYLERCMTLNLGFQGQTLASGIHGAMSLKGDTYGQTGFPVEAGAVTYDGDAIKGKVTVATKTLDLVPCEYTWEIDGRIMEAYVSGTCRMTLKVEGAEPVTRDGGFEGKWSKGIQSMAAADNRPWWTPVKDFKPVEAGEHPRLLFRKSDLPMLRRKMETPEGKAILARLKKLLNGADGDTLPTSYSKADKAYDEDSDKRLPAGTYTMSHMAGYGLLYQLTGDKKYAEFGKQCFEMALKGQRDRDDRYSFKNPGGPLRAGPVLGYTALGFDLCYDGWDEETRAKVAKALETYDEGAGAKDGGGKMNFEALVRGTMPPGSNHFGMQVGGASMVAMVLNKEPGVDQKQIDTFLKIGENSMVRNMTEGFGDGGFFAEGDGTGSMSSHIIFLTALQSWKNSMGMDFLSVERPNARMMALKWVYLTVVRGGGTDFWPIRGTYGQNVWSRGLSGCGYFAVGFGSVTEEQKAGMKWYYNHFLAQPDAARGMPFGTDSVYPHTAISAFVNWPVDLEARNPAEVLPLCYRDSIHSFYAWRNRWQDDNDVVISVLTNDTHGYMGAKTDKGMQVAAFGKKFTWAPVTGDVKFWNPSPRGEASVLTTAGGTSVAVDFTRASGADAMLVTTAQADGEKVTLGKATLTFKFVTAGEPPKVTVEGEQAVVGKQRVSLKDGNLVLAVTARP